MPASLRVIKIVKDRISGDDAYTVELEIEAHEGTDLLKELLKCSYGKRLIDLLDRASFLPEGAIKTEEELKLEAQKEGETIKKRETELKERGAREGVNKYISEIRAALGDDFIKDMDAKIKAANEAADKSKIKKLAGDIEKPDEEK